MDTQLFMECEEEELEPWQQVDDTVDEDDDFMDYTQPVEDSPDSTPPSESPPPAPPPAPVPKVSVPVQTQIRSFPVSVATPSITNKTKPTILKTTPTTKAPPILQQATPLILSQLPQGTFIVTTQGFPMMNSGTPLVFNLPPGSTVLQPGQTLVNSGEILKPGQTVLKPGHTLLKPGEMLKPGQTLFKPGQPLTLIQSPPVGQIVRPVTPVRGSAPSAPGLMHLTIRTSTPERATPVGGVSSGSALVASSNGAPRSITIQLPKPAPGRPALAGLPASAAPAKPASGPALVTAAPNRTVVTFSPPRLVAPPPDPADPSRVVMSVEEFYYGSHDGDERLRDSHKYTAMLVQFPCQLCPHQANNNLRLMQHMLTHWKPVNRGDDRKSCKFCYRHFSSASDLQTHLEKVHGPAPSNSLCRICEWAFDNEPVFLNHMKTNHKPGEMPYICQVCFYRSSFYSDVIQHFATFHRETRFLLCVFCLKVLKNSETYQQHLLRHQNESYHCNRCRLQFIYVREKVHHKTEHHRSFKRPARLEGLPPGSKVTIRTFGRRRAVLPSDLPRPSQPVPAPSNTNLAHSNMIQPISLKPESQPLPVLKSRSAHKKPLALEHSTPSVPLWRCVECGDQVGALSAHYPTHVRCLLCSFRTCCSKAYAGHMILSHHFPRSKEPIPRFRRGPPPSHFSVVCSDCRFTPSSGDEMALHLALNPTHTCAMCTPRVLSDLDMDLRLLEPLRSNRLAPPPGVVPPLAAGDWSTPDSLKAAVAPFTQWAGPSHNLPRAGDALDFFDPLFPAELVTLIATATDAHATAQGFLLRDPLLSDWTRLTSDELKAFLGLVILMGLQNLPDPAQYWSCHHDQSHLFNQVMSHRRFTQILQSLRPGIPVPAPLHRSPAPLSRSQAHQKDPLQLFRRMLQIQGQAMWESYRPNCCLSLDRALLPGTPSQDQNPGLNPDRPRPGPALPQVWLLCDSKSGYCHRLNIQTAPGPRRGPGSSGPGSSLVLDLLSGLEQRHHQLFLSNALCSVELLNVLHLRGIYGSGSFPRNHPHFPPSLWDDRPLEHPGDFVQKQRGVVLATRWMDVKEMGCLSTNAAPGNTDTVWRRSQSKPGTLDPLDRPESFRLLQENMRGADICKQLLACNALGGVASERRWRNLFWFLVNVSVVNAFILLRETRRDCPPDWVQKGLFTQETFRRRLGTQLTKCFKRQTPAVAPPPVLPVPAPSAPPAPGPQQTQRHRLTKVSKQTKRCKNCVSKSLRRESVHGCLVCRANLCQSHVCFWEYHGLSPDTPVSAKLGFMKNAQTGQISFVDPQKEAGFSAPLDDSEEEGAESVDSVDQSFPSVLQELFSERQLQIALCALCEGVTQAARLFSADARLVRRWLREANANVRPEPERSEVTDRLLKYVLSTRQQEGALTYAGLVDKVSSLKRKGAVARSFRFSYDRAVSFMLRTELQYRGVGTPASLELPPELSRRVPAFQTFTRKVVAAHRLPSVAVATMDELCLFVNPGLTRTSAARDALQTTGVAPAVTVYLSALADGTLLPALVLTDAEPDEKTLPEFVLADVAPGNAEEALELWRRRVWTEHVRDARLDKSLLILDAHREHGAEAFLAALGETGTLPALIPKGLCHRLQPLDVCVKPVIQRFLLRRWRALAADRRPDGPDVTATLVRWTLEALAHVDPEVVGRSFAVAGVLREEHEERELQEVQDELMRTLSLKITGQNMSWDQEPDFWDMEPSPEDKMEDEKERELTRKKQDSETNTEDESEQNGEKKKKRGEEEEEEKQHREKKRRGEEEEEKQQHREKRGEEEEEKQHREKKRREEEEEKQQHREKRGEEEEEEKRQHREKREEEEEKQHREKREEEEEKQHREKRRGEEEEEKQQHREKKRGEEEEEEEKRLHREKRRGEEEEEEEKRLHREKKRRGEEEEKQEELKDGEREEEGHTMNAPKPETKLIKEKEDEGQEEEETAEEEREEEEERIREEGEELKEEERGEREEEGDKRDAQKVETRVRKEGEEQKMDEEREEGGEEEELTEERKEGERGEIEEEDAEKTEEEITEERGKEEAEEERESERREEEKEEVKRPGARILMGADLGDEWQVKVQSLDDDKMDES